MNYNEINLPNYLISHYRKNVTEDPERNKRSANRIFSIIRESLQRTELPDLVSGKEIISINLALEGVEYRQHYLTICNERNPSPGRRPYLAMCLV